MKISTETLVKVIAMLKALLSHFMSKAYETLRIHITKGNIKLGFIHNWSMAPILSCGNCEKCKFLCYDIKACLMYLTVRIARCENLAMMLKDMPATFEQISKYIATRRKHFFFRWHVSGEILNYEYFEHMVTIAKMFPQWRFYTYTKMYTLVNVWIENNGGSIKAIPENLVVMFSRWEGVEMLNPYGLPEFWAIEKGATPPKGFHKCSGKCKNCIDGHCGCIYGQSSYTTLH